MWRRENWWVLFIVDLYIIEYLIFDNLLIISINLLSTLVLYKLKVEQDPLTEQQIIRQWKLNHGLSLDGSSIQSSKKAVLGDDGDLSIRLYKGEPVVYTNIN